LIKIKDKFSCLKRGCFQVIGLTIPDEQPLFVVVAHAKHNGFL